MRTPYARIRPTLSLILAAGLWLVSAPAPVSAEVFKWIDDNDVAHYTSNRASIPIKYQDTVRIVEPEPASNLYQTREIAVPDTRLPDLQEEYLPPEPGFEPRKPGTDVVGEVLETPGGQPPPSAAAEPAPPERRSARLGLKSYTGKGEGWWRSRFTQANSLVDRQQRIVDAHRKQLRKIIKSHASGNEVIPLEDDAEFQKMARVLPREESRLNKFKRDRRRLEAHADELRIPESWRR